MSTIDSNAQQGIAHSIFQQPLQVTLGAKMQMLAQSKFSVESDFHARFFGNFLYTIDGYAGNLHVYSVKD
jgi:hypothetical protein